MSRGRLLLLLLTVVPVGLAVAGWLLWPAPSAISQENFDRIQVGMTLAEVEALMGEKAPMQEPGNLTGAAARPGETTYLWGNAWDGVILIVCQDDRVTFKTFQPAAEMPIMQRIGIWMALR